MAREAQPITSPGELLRTAEAVARSGRRRTVRLGGTTLTIGVHVAGSTSSRSSRANGFLAAYGSVPPLTRLLTDTEIAEIAADEAAQEAALAGLPDHAGA